MFAKIATALFAALVLTGASSPAWSQSLVGDGWAGSIQPNSRYCRVDLASGHCQWPYAPARDQGNADWR
jgi:hypothetical protein